MLVDCTPLRSAIIVVPQQLTTELRINIYILPPRTKAHRYHHLDATIAIAFSISSFARTTDQGTHKEDPQERARKGSLWSAREYIEEDDEAFQ